MIPLLPHNQSSEICYCILHKKDSIFKHLTQLNLKTLTFLVHLGPAYQFTRFRIFISVGIKEFVKPDILEAVVL